MATAIRLDSITSAPNGTVGVLDYLRTYTAMMTPTQAQHILSNQMWPRQRVLRASHVDYLVSVIERGELRRLSLEFAEMPDGQRWLVDGQHRLSALVRANATLPAAITVTRCATAEDVSHLYLTIDRQATRNAFDGLRAFGVDEQVQVSHTVLARIGRGVSLAETNFSRTARQNKSLIWRTEATRRWMPEGLRYAEHLAGSSNEVQRLLWRGPVTAVALVTLRHSSFADEFWSRVASQEMLTADDPRSRLMAWLRSHRVADIGSEVVYARHVATCWNAFAEGRTLKIVKVQDPSAPVRLTGTPISGDHPS